MEDSLYLLDEAEQMLKDISVLQDRALNEDLQRSLSFKVKNLLAALNSSLDYSAYHVFETFCLEKASMKYSNIDYIKRKIYFPCYQKEDHFEKQINKHFVGLKDNHEFLYQVFKIPQEFMAGSTWLSEFKKLSNESKHVRLTRNKRLYSGTINHLSIPGVVTVINHKFEGDEQIMAVNDTPIDLANIQSHSEIKSYEGEFISYFSFEGSSKPIVETLEFYLNMVKEIVTSINDYCKSQQIDK